MVAADGLSAGLRGHFGKVIWLLAEKAFLLASSFIVGFWVVRYLGPEQFGRFSAALSVTALLVGFANMGLETAILRRLAARVQEPERVLASGAVLRFAGTCFQILICWPLATLMFAADRDIAFVALILACAAIFQVSDLIGLRLQAENCYRRASLARIAARIAGDAMRVGLIYHQATIHWFAAAVVFEASVACAIFLAAGRASFGVRFVPSRDLIRSLFEDGAPVMVSGIVAASYARLDQVILFNLLGPTETGTYAAAVRVSEVFNLLVVSIATVAASAFGRAHSLSASRFEAALLPYYRSMLALGFSISLILCLLAGPVVGLLYGPSFAATVPILRVHAWSVVLVFASAALEPWFYQHGKLRYLVWKTLIGLGFALPAVYVGTLVGGPVGTAAAVVFTYFVSVVGSNAMLPAIRPAFAFQRRATTGFLGFRK